MPTALWRRFRLVLERSFAANESHGSLDLPIAGLWIIVSVTDQACSLWCDTTICFAALWHGSRFNDLPLDLSSCEHWKRHVPGFAAEMAGALSFSFSRRGISKGDSPFSYHDGLGQ